MALQSQVGLYYAPAVQGDRATNNPMVYTTHNPISSGEVTIGNFVFPGDYSFFEAKVGVDSDAQPLGIVERVQYYYIYNVLEDGQITVPDGNPLTVVRKGDVWVKLADTMAVGDQVKADADTGAPGSSGIDTDWIVKYVDSSGLAIISNWDSNTSTSQATPDLT